MDIYAQFDLPPPPPPTAFSWWSGPERARLPNFTNVTSAAAFLDKLTIYQHPKAYQAQFLMGIGYLAVILSLSVAIIHKKLQQKAWWLFRVVRRNQGILIVPQVHNVWALGAGLYGLTCISSFLTEYIYWRKAAPVPHLTMWVVLQWSPMSFACAWQAWGISVARSQSSPSTPSPHTAAKRTPRPAIINYIWLFVPVGQFLICLTIALLSDRKFEQARHERQRWISKWSSAPQLEKEMLLDLIDIWTHIMRSWYFVCIALTMWAIYTFSLFWVYSTVSWCLIASLRKHISMLQRRETTTTVNRMAHRTPGSFSFNSSTLFSGTIDAHNTPQDSPNLDQVNSPNTAVFEEAANATPALNSVRRFRGHGKGDSADQSRSGLFTEKAERQVRSESFFPPVASSATVRPSSKLASQAHWVLRYFMIESISISCGIICLLSLAVFLASTLYSAAEFALTERYEGIPYLAASWVTFVFGSITMLSICHATYESSFSQLLRHADQTEAEHVIGISTLDRSEFTPPTRPPPIWSGQYRGLNAGPVRTNDPEQDDVAETDDTRRSPEQQAIQGLLSPQDFRSYPRREHGLDRVSVLSSDSVHQPYSRKRTSFDTPAASEAGHLRSPAIA
ncbi:hypothetical protein OC845_002146 [Tilletia horrida]|nr:hypothetical protein OC845_002146 [Tilletia horrida]